MKKIAVILSFTLPIFCSAQTIHFDDREIPYSIYIGFVNTFTIVTSIGMDMNEMSVSCINCQLEKLTNSDTEHLKYNITPNKGFTKVQLQIRDKKDVLLREEYFQVSRLPTYDILIGDQRSGGVLNKENLELSVGLPSEISLRIPTEILSWEVTIGDKIYAGKGEGFTEEVKAALKDVSKEQTISINCWAKEVKTGVSRKLTAEFKGV